MRLSMTVAALLLLVTALALAQGQSTGVTAQAIGQANLRADDSIHAPLVGEITAGTSYPVIGRSQFYPWLLLGERDSHTPKGWVYDTLVIVQGNIHAVPYSDLILQATTPTPLAAAAPAVIPPTSTPSASSFGVTGEVIGEVNIRYGPGIEYPRVGVAFAGERYEITGYHTQFPWVRIRFGDTASQQAWIARDLLKISGSLNKAQAITQLSLGLPTLTATPPVISASTIAGQAPVPLGAAFQALGNDLWNLVLDNGFDPQTSRFGALFVMEPQPPPRPILSPQTSANQVSANPDFSNQLTVSEAGALLAHMYQCAYNERSALIDIFGSAVDARECRQMLHVMSNNTVDALLKAGVPADVRVAHKHGWIPDTHGNAALFFTPGGDYVIAMMLFQPDWLNFQESLPVIAEVSRRVYNYFNPQQPQPSIRDGYIPDANNCNYSGDPLVADLMRSVWLE